MGPADPPKPPSVNLKQFLLDYISSYDELAVLLLLMRNADREWYPEAIVEQLGAAPGGYHTTLENLAVQGLLVFRGADRFAYAPTRGDLQRSAEALNRAYQENRTAVIQLMNASAITRVKTGAVQTFGDMLRLHRVK